MRKEEAPPITTAQLERKPREKGRHYRYIGNDKETRDIDRIGHHEDLGYRVEGKSRKMALVSCDDDEFQGRQTAARDKANKTRKQRMESDAGFQAETTTMTEEKIQDSDVNDD